MGTRGRQRNRYLRWETRKTPAKHSDDKKAEEIHKFCMYVEPIESRLEEIDGKKS